MEESNDLYAVLGVLPTAEDVVIHAAYRILSQRYHPDRYKGDPAEGAARLKRIQDAYATLSDPARRAKYDQDAESLASEEPGDAVRGENLLDAPGWRPDWDLACHFYPNLRDTESQFRAMSSALGFTFCATLLETRRFPEGEAIARQMEQAYLGRSFGDNPEILAFAKRLLVAGKTEAVRTLRHALKVLGSSTPAGLIIDTLTRDFLQAPAKGAREPESEPEPDPAASAATGKTAAEETLPESAAEPAVEEPIAEEIPVEELAEPAPEAAAPAEPEGLHEEESAGAAPALAGEEEPSPAEPAEKAEAVAEAQAPAPEPTETPEPEFVTHPAAEEPVVANEPPPTPEPAPVATATAGTKPAPPKHVFKDTKKRASAQGVLRACRAGEALELDSAVSLVRAMDGTVNLKKTEAQFGDVRVEVKFRGQSIMFSSSEFVEWVQRKILPEAKASV